MPPRRDSRILLARVTYGGVCALVILASAWVLARRVQEPIWPAAAAALGGRVGPDEAVVLLPAAARLEARHFDGLPVLAGVPADVSQLAGLWVVAGPAHAPGELDALVARYRRVERVALGDSPEDGSLVHLREPLARAFDLVTRFRSAEVWRTAGDGRIERCERMERGKRDCGGPWWRDVGPHTAPFTGERLRGIWLHPVEGWTTVLSYPEVPAGARVVLRLGLDDDARRVRTDPSVGPVRVAVRLGPAERLVDLWPTDGIVTRVVDVPPDTEKTEQGGGAALVIEATATEDHYANLFVFGEVLQ